VLQWKFNRLEFYLLIDSPVQKLKVWIKENRAPSIDQYQPGKSCKAILSRLPLSAQKQLNDKHKVLEFIKQAWEKGNIDENHIKNYSDWFIRSLREILARIYTFHPLSKECISTYELLTLSPPTMCFLSNTLASVIPLIQSGEITLKALDKAIQNAGPNQIYDCDLSNSKGVKAWVQKYAALS
jgi:hypothetical protein